jgi:acyl-CoA thioesterase YciA
MADAASEPAGPRGELSIRTLAMPSDTNQNGDIFGGWLLGQMDIAGSIFAYKVANGRTVTVAVDGMVFHKPVYVGDVVSVFSSLIKVGRTSVAVHVEAWVMRRNEDNLLHVTDGNFTYVAIDDENRPRPVHP